MNRLSRGLAGVSALAVVAAFWYGRADSQTFEPGARRPPAVAAGGYPGGPEWDYGTAPPLEAPYRDGRLAGGGYYYKAYGTDPSPPYTPQFVTSWPETGPYPGGYFGQSYPGSGDGFNFPGYGYPGGYGTWPSQAYGAPGQYRQGGEWGSRADGYGYRSGSNPYDSYGSPYSVGYPDGYARDTQWPDATYPGPGIGQYQRDAGYAGAWQEYPRRNSPWRDPIPQGMEPGEFYWGESSMRPPPPQGLDRVPVPPSGFPVSGRGSPVRGWPDDSGSESGEAPPGGWMPGWETPEAVAHSENAAPPTLPQARMTDARLGPAPAPPVLTEGTGGMATGPVPEDSVAREYRAPPQSAPSLRELPSADLSGRGVVPPASPREPSRIMGRTHQEGTSSLEERVPSAAESNRAESPSGKDKGPQRAPTPSAFPQVGEEGGVDHAPAPSPAPEPRALPGQAAPGAVTVPVPGQTPAASPGQEPMHRGEPLSGLGDHGLKAMVWREFLAGS